MNPEYICSACGQSFTVKRNLQRHVLCVHDKNHFECQKCHKQYTRRTHLLHHICKSGNGIDSNLYSCKICSTSFKKLHHLTLHCQEHHCNITPDVPTIRKGTYGVNMNPKYICSACGKSFTAKHNLQRHVQCVHNTNITPDVPTISKGTCGVNMNPEYICSACGKSFTVKSNLLRHVLCVHDKKHFECQKCHKQYTRRQHLLHHICKSANGIDSNLYSCKICSTSFKKLQHFTLHCQEHQCNITPENEDFRQTSATGQQSNEGNHEENSTTLSGEPDPQSRATIPNPPEDSFFQTPARNPMLKEASFPVQQIESTSLTSDTKRVKEEVKFEDDTKDLKQGFLFKTTCDSFEEAAHLVKHLSDDNLNNDSKEWITQELVPSIKDNSSTFSTLHIEFLYSKMKNESNNTLSKSHLHLAPLETNRQTGENDTNQRFQENIIGSTVDKQCPANVKETLEQPLKEAPKRGNTVSSYVDNTSTLSCTTSDERSSDISNGPLPVFNSLPSESISRNTVEQNQRNTRVKAAMSSSLSKTHTNSIFCTCALCCEDSHRWPKPLLLKYAGYNWSCDVCDKKYSQPNKLREHKQSKCGTVMICHCSFCAKGFISRTRLKYHLDSTTCGGKSNIITTLTQCKLCDKKYATSKGLRDHINNVHSTKKYVKQSFTCDLCQKVYQHNNHLKRHFRRAHGKGKFECGHCAKIYNCKELLASHIQVKHMVGHVKCDHCSQRFIEERSLERHKTRQHSDGTTDTRPYMCEICGKKFKRKFNLKKHLLIHEEKSLVCDVCGKCFRTKPNLDQHARTHSHIRPFVCDMCGKSFKIRNHLCQHMAVHGMANTSWKGNRKRKDFDANSIN